MRFCFIGEAMLELTRDGLHWRMGYGGDTLNTAIHLARDGFNVAYASALGADPYSLELRQAWGRERLDTSLVLTDATRLPGLYAIQTDQAGERRFHFWRAQSAARGMFTLPDFARVARALETADVLVFSLITLAIIPEAAREELFAIARKVQARGGKVAFDGNYRESLWANAGEARAARDKALACCDIGLPTLEDEISLSGANSAADVALAWRGLGAREVVVKLGAQGCLIENGQRIAPLRVVVPVDTSGAGDAFNAGYLSVRMRGGTIEDAARRGHELAGWAISQPGAIPKRTADAPYRN